MRAFPPSGPHLFNNNNNNNNHRHLKGPSRWFTLVTALPGGAYRPGVLWRALGDEAAAASHRGCAQRPGQPASLHQPGRACVLSARATPRLMGSLAGRQWQAAGSKLASQTGPAKFGQNVWCRNEPCPDTRRPLNCRCLPVCFPCDAIPLSSRLAGWLADWRCVVVGTGSSEDVRCVVLPQLQPPASKPANRAQSCKNG